ncbi:MAG TPA: S1/P1 nuclease [Pyrinomonadaceae bacterium]|nr:S1/P1 nuclease [Pyrinomonadaceae bacterium]
MSKLFRVLLMAAALGVPQTSALAWHDTGHMVVAQIAYLRLSPSARAHVERLLAQPEGNRRPLVFYCDKTYDPVTIAVWMDDIKGDSLADEYSPWHYTNFRPIFDGIPERTNVAAEPVNVVDRLNWSISTLSKGTGRAKSDAEILGFIYHLVGDVHQPLHAATRYSAKNPDGDAGGNGFAVQMPPETRIRNLHSYWDSAAGLFGYESPRRPLDEAGRARLRTYADDLMRRFPADANQNWKNVEPHDWAVESNHLARTFAYAKIRDGEAPSKAYADEAQRLSAERITLAGYRLAEVLNRVFPNPPAPPTPARR